ncbi:hypothetical protein [Aeromonas simiae]|uniref:hypothetical protein n=1 Tax=Aeromonas simiae TaxID=218936 RepID=UPI000A72A009|nr:hypothetical protein [Aeromonas simiae]
MTMAKKYFICAIFLLLNTPEILYQVSFKLNIDSGFVYVLMYSVLMVLLIINIKLVTKKQLFFCVALSLYGLFQVVNSVINNVDIKNAMVVFMSTFIPIAIYIFMYRKTSDDVGFYIEKSMVLGMLYFIIVDVLSIIIMHKSQHVILSNVLPIFLLGMMSLSIYRNNINRIWLIFTIYCVWIFFSVSFFTSDIRFQMKAIIITITLFFSYVLYDRYISKFRGVSIPSYIYVVLFFIYLIVLSLCLEHIMSNSFDGREASLGLRVLVAENQINDIFSGDIFNYVFGYGYGSSMKQYEVYYDGIAYLLRSHSGIISLVYENGFFIVIVLLVYLIRLLRLKPINKICHESISWAHRRSKFILFIFMCTLTLMNIIYLISIPVPNYAHQSQMVLSTLIFIFLNKNVNRC